MSIICGSSTSSHNAWRVASEQKVTANSIPLNPTKDSSTMLPVRIKLAVAVILLSQIQQDEKTSSKRKML